MLKRKKEKKQKISLGQYIKLWQSCNCDKYTIGDTGRAIEKRMKEHERGANYDQEKASGLSQHLKQTNHEANFNDVKVLYKEKDFRKRRFKEAFTIKKHKSNLLNRKEEIQLLSNVPSRHMTS